MTARKKKAPKTWRDAVPRRAMKKRNAKSGRQRKVKVAIVTATANCDPLPSLTFTKPIIFIRPLCFAVYESEVIAVGANSGIVREWIATNLVTRKRTTTK